MAKKKPTKPRAKSPIQKNTKWRIFIPLLRWKGLKTNEHFHAILRVSRMANSLRFAQVALLGNLNTEEPSAQRQRMGSFFYATALLNEALKYTRTLEKKYGHLPEYKRGFGKLHRDKTLMEFNDKVMKRVRDKMVFHLDPEVIPEALATADLDDWNLAIGVGKTKEHMYFQLADHVLMHFLIGSPGDKNQIAGKMRESIEAVVKIIIAFDGSADLFVGRVGRDLGARLRIDD